MNFVGNLTWLIFGGFLAAMGYVFSGFLLCLTIIGIPFGLQCFKIAMMVFWPFGKKLVSKDGSGGCLTTLFTIIWIITGGIYTAIVHLVFGVILTITIIGIPFARQHFKLAALTLSPFDKNIVSD